MSAKTTIALVSVEGSLDVTTVPAVRRRIDRLVADGYRRIVINMAQSPYVDSAGLGLILTELRRIRCLGGLVSLINVSPQVFRALSRMRMVDYLPVSQAGSVREVRALDPGVLPLWRTTFRVDAHGLAESRERLGKLISRLPFSSDESFDLVLAAGEALGNAVDHTCGCGVLATVAAYPDRVTVDVADCGEGFSPEDCPGAQSSADERGRGLALMRLLTDSVSIERKSSGTGMVVHLVKLFSTSSPVSPATS